MIGQLRIGRDARDAETFSTLDEWGTTITVTDRGVAILGRSGQEEVVAAQWSSPLALYWYDQMDGKFLVVGLLDRSVLLLDLTNVPSSRVVGILLRSPDASLRRLELYEVAGGVLVVYECGLLCIRRDALAWRHDDLGFGDMLQRVDSGVAEYANESGRTWSYSLETGAISRLHPPR